MTPVYNLQTNDCVRDWLMRVDTQYHEETPEKVKAADGERARQTLESNTIYNLFFSSSQPSSFFHYTAPQPASRGWFSSGDTNTASNSYNTTTTNIHHTTHVYNSVDSSSESEDEGTKGSKGASKKKKLKEEKTDWKSIAAIGVVSTAVAGISIFVYARLSKVAEGARNYLENTNRIKQWSEGSASPNALYSKISRVAQAQLKIDQKVVNKITHYKYAMLTSLVGTLAMAGGGITILAASIATAGTTAFVAGVLLNAIAVMYASYNCAMHWSDKEDGKKEMSKFKQEFPSLINSFKSDALPQNQPYNTSWQNPQYSAPSYAEYSQPSVPPAYSEFQQPWETPPSYDASQAIYNQRASNIYPDLAASAPMEHELPRMKS